MLLLPFLLLPCFLCHFYYCHASSAISTTVMLLLPFLLHPYFFCHFNYCHASYFFCISTTAISTTVMLLMHFHAFLLLICSFFHFQVPSAIFIPFVYYFQALLLPFHAISTIFIFFLSFPFSVCHSHALLTISNDMLSLPFPFSIYLFLALLIISCSLYHSHYTTSCPFPGAIQTVCVLCSTYHINQTYKFDSRA